MIKYKAIPFKDFVTHLNAANGLTMVGMRQTGRTLAANVIVAELSQSTGNSYTPVGVHWLGVISKTPIAGDFLPLPNMGAPIKFSYNDTTYTYGGAASKDQTGPAVKVQEIFPCEAGKVPYVGTEVLVARLEMPDCNYWILRTKGTEDQYYITVLKTVLHGEHDPYGVLVVKDAHRLAGKLLNWMYRVDCSAVAKLEFTDEELVMLPEKDYVWLLEGNSWGYSYAVGYRVARTLLQVKESFSVELDGKERIYGAW